jgi:isoleucyl-tRNA synthetase
MQVIMSHGFTVDEDGHKMSKSLGNVVTPKELVAKIGTDGVRLWVSCLAHEGDLVLSAQVIEHVSRVQNKIRNTCRFLLQNLYDFNYAVDAVAIEELLLMDGMALVHFARFQEQIIRDYQAYDVTGVFHAVADYSTTFLSAVYCDIVKDRLYVSQPSHKGRRSAQTVLWHMLDGLTKLIAPILSFCAEQLAQHYIHEWTGSVHLQSFNTLSAQVELLAERLYSADRLPLREQAATRGQAFQAEVYEVWQELLAVRSVVMKAIEEQRERGLIKHSLQAHVVLAISPRPLFETAKRYAQTMHQSLEEFLQELCVVSQLSFKQAGGVQDCLAAQVVQATGLKCPRCWQWRVSTHVDGLCDRCETIVAQIRD